MSRWDVLRRGTLAGGSPMRCKPPMHIAVLCHRNIVFSSSTVMRFCFDFFNSLLEIGHVLADHKAYFLIWGTVVHTAYHPEPI